MRTAAELSGLAVVSATTGERLGRIHDVLFEGASGRITGFVVHGGGLLAKPQLLRRLLVRSLGADAVVVEGGAVLEEVDSEPALSDSLSARSLDDRPVLDESGKAVGKVAGVLVDEATITVPALLLAAGLIDKVLHGKPQLPLSVIKAFGADSLVVPISYDPKAADQHAARR
jgi:uncharacterized protein YrrD